MSSLNKAMLIGRLGQDPECRYTQSNTCVANFSIATTERYKDRNGEQQEKTTWHNCVAWGRLGEICQEYLKKGSLVYVEGPIQTSTWEKEGETRYKTEVKVLSMQMLDSKGNRQGNFDSSGGSNNPVEVDDSFDSMDDDLPFMWITPLLIPVSYVVLNLL